MILSVCGVLVAGLGVGVLTGSAAGHVKAGSVAATVITVTAGQPSELAFKVSKASGIPAGTVTFKFTNKGKISHDFKICTSPAKTSAANSCVGKVTAILAPGKSATLTVKLSKSGKYEYLCTVPGHAAAGMKGLIGIGVKVATPPPKPTTTTKTNPVTTTVPSSSVCAHPTSTTVSVAEYDFGFTVSPSTVPCGTVTFNQTNTGQTQHNFDLTNVPAAGGDGAYINPGQNTTMTVTLTPGSWGYQCDVPTHAALGMVGVLNVTG